MPPYNTIILKIHKLIKDSSMHHDVCIDFATGVQKKTKMIIFYNNTKSGVDLIDEKFATYSTSRRCQR